MSTDTRGVDSVSVLSVFLVLRFAIPAVLVVSPLGAAGNPATIFGLGCLGWWAYSQVSRPQPRTAGQSPVRLAAFVFVAVSLCSYVAAAIRPTDQVERNVADLAVVSVLSWVGVLLVVHDEIDDEQRLLTLMRRLVALTGAMATLGVVQFLLSRPIVDRLRIPGLTNLDTLLAPSYGLLDRGGFGRAIGTTSQPIEFGAVLTLVLPLALALAVTDRDRHPIRRTAPAAIIMLAIAVAISRSAVIGAFVGLAVLVPALTREAQLRLVAAGGVMGVFVFVMVPGLLGTILQLFTGAGTDPSVRSRTDSYPMAAEFVERAPLFGRGVGTFLPRYRILDNQYLLSVIEVGIVGLVVTVGLLVTAMVVGMKASRAARDELGKIVSRGVVAGIAAGTVELAFYDGFSFLMFAALLFMMMGVAGAMWRLQEARDQKGMVPG